MTCTEFHLVGRGFYLFDTSLPMELSHLRWEDDTVYLSMKGRYFEPPQEVSSLPAEMYKCRKKVLR